MSGPHHIVQTCDWLRRGSRSQLTDWNDRVLMSYRSYERPQLNDRPIYLKSVHLMLGLVQGMLHLYYDYGRIHLECAIQSGEGNPKNSVPPIMQVWKGLPPLMVQTLRRALLISFIGPFIYVIFIQQLAWAWNLKFAKLVWSISRTAKPSWWKPFNYSMYLRSLSSGFLLTTLWELSNITFSMYLAQPPLKGGEPLTDNFKGSSKTSNPSVSDGNSKGGLMQGDPNGSLLNGLKSKKETTKVRESSIFIEIANTRPEFCFLGIILYQSSLRD